VRTRDDDDKEEEEEEEEEEEDDDDDGEARECRNLRRNAPTARDKVAAARAFDDASALP
jgi:hypothetical protein